MLILVRHAEPSFGPHAPPEDWELSDAGRAGAASLVGVLPRDALLVASAEPKARQTLEPCGSVSTDDRFNEIRRHEAYTDDFRRLRLEYVGGADHVDWEPRDQAAARFHAGIADWQRRAGARPLVVASHGMAMTTWLAATIGLHDPATFWSDLRMPDAFVVDTAGGTATRIPPISPVDHDVTSTTRR